MSTLSLPPILGCGLFAAALIAGCSRTAPQVAPGDAALVQEAGGDSKRVEVEAIQKLPSVEPVVSREPTPDLAAGQTLRGTLRAQFGTRTQTFNSGQFTADGLRLVGGGYGPAALVWDLATGEEAGRLAVFAAKEGSLLGIERAFLSPDGATVVTMANRLGGVLLWDRAKAAVRLPLKTEGGLRRAAFSPDSKTLYIRDNSSGLSRWDAASGELRAKSDKLVGISSDADVVVTPDGKTVVLGGEKGDVILFDGATLKEKKRWPAHKRGLHGLALSPDGKTLATIAFDEGLVKLWDLETAAEIRSTKYDRGLQMAVAFSPSGKILAVGGSSVTLWDVKSGAELGFLYGFSGNLNSLAFSPDGSLVAGTPNSQRGVVVWELSRGPEKRTLAQGDRDEYLALAPGGTRAIRKTAKGAEFRDLTTGKTLWSVAAERLSASTFSPDGKLFACSKTGDKVTLIDAETGVEKATIESPDGLSVQSMVFRPDGKRLTIGGYSDVRFCDLGGDKPAVLPTPKLAVRAESLAYHPAGKTLAVGVGPTLRLFDGETGKTLWAVPAHEGLISTVAFSPDGTRILTVYRDQRDRSARLWDATDGKPIAVFRHEQNPVDAFFSEEGRTVVTTDYRSDLFAWDALSGKRLGNLTARSQESPRLFAPGRNEFLTTGDKKLHFGEASAFTREAIGGHAGLPRTPAEAAPAPVYAPGTVLRGPGESLYFCGFSADGKRMVTADGKQRATVWDATAGKPVRSFALDIGPVEAAAGLVAGMSADGKTLAIGGRDGAVRLVDLETGKQRHAMKGHESFVRVVAFSPDGKHVASGTGGFAQTELFLWDAGTGMKVRQLARGGAMIDGLAFTPDNKTLVVAANGDGIRLFDVETGGERPKLVHTEDVTRVAVSPDGATVAAGGGFSSLGLNDVTVWDLKGGKRLHTLTGHPHNISDLAFGPDGLLVVRAGRTHLWNATTGKPVRVLTEGVYRALSSDGKWLVAETERGVERFDTATLRDDRLQTALAPVLRLGGMVRPEGDGLHVEMALPGGPDSVAAMAALESVPQLRSLKIDRAEMMPAAATQSIAKMRSLRSLTINASDLDDAQVARLAALSELTTLDLSHCRNITVPGFAALAKLSKLEDVRLAGTQMTAPGLVPLVGLKNLRSLDVSGASVRTEGLEVLTKYPALTDLNLGSGIEDDGLEKLKGLTKLRTLMLEGSDITDAGLAHAAEMTALEKLDLTRSKITDAGLAHLKPMTNLKSLNLSSTQVTDAGFVHLAGMTKLTSIGLYGLEKFTGAGLQHLRPATGLTTLNLNGTGVTDAGLAGLKDWTRLVSLELPETIGDDGLLHLAKLAKLETINLSNLKKLKGPGLAGLKDAMAIVSLDLRNLPVTDAGLDGVKDWKHLAKLELPKNITDAGLAKLAGLRSLKVLEAEGATGITDAGLVHLKGLVNLETLGLRGTKITDAGLATLEGMTNLGNLSVGNTGVTDAGVEKLKKKLPNAYVSKF
jgi:WD40 repeat protein/Leucine-rich repeat (LRR) protein